MSDTKLRFIPEDPTYVPEAAAIEAARAALGEAAGVPATARVAAGVEFVDQGENFERVACPACGSELEMGWWGERMKDADATSFRELGVTVPCCGAETSLHDLDYEAPAGFARFVLEAPNPGVDVEAVDAEPVERAAGCLLRRIVARY